MTKRLTNEEFIQRVRKKFPHAKWSFEKTRYKNRRTSVVITCHEVDENGVEHGDFEILPSNLLGSNIWCCKKCWHQSAAMSTSDFIRRVMELYPFQKWDFTKTVYIDYWTPVTITCLETDWDGVVHGDFTVIPDKLFNRKVYPCKKCRREKKMKEQGQITLEKTKEIHKDRDWTYEKYFYKGNRVKVTITCHEIGPDGKEHGDFDITPSHLLRGQGCRLCKGSKLEKKTRTLLCQMDITHESWKQFQWLGLQHLDFYLPDYNIAIECQGEQHYQPVDFAGKGQEWAEDRFRYIQQLDEQKKRLCKEHNLPLFYIRYDDNVEEVLTQILGDAKKRVS